MTLLYDISNPDSNHRRAASIYDVRQDWRHADDDNFMVCTSTICTRFFKTEAQALKAAADFVKKGSTFADAWIPDALRQEASR